MPEAYYTTSRIDWLLRNWGNWLALAETPTTAAGLVHAGPTPESPRSFAKSEHHQSDPRRWSDIRVDILTAASQLGDYSLEWYAVNARIQGMPLDSLAQMVAAWSYPMVVEAYERALGHMAAALDGAHAEPFGRAVLETSPLVCEAVGCGRLHARRSRYCSAACKQRTWRRRILG